MDRRCGRRFYFYLLLAVAVIFCHSKSVSAAEPKQFSADMVSRSGGNTQNAKIYVSQDKLRTDTAGSIIIVRRDKDVTWMILTLQHMYMEMPIDRKMLPQTSKNIEGEVERESLGKETIDGIPVEKFKVTYEVMNKRVSVYQWLTDSGIPIKTEAIDGSWSMEYKNISFGPQPDSLFELPEGYQKLSMPSGVGAGMQ